MALRSLGTLTLDMVAKIGGFVAGMDAAQRKADKTSRSIEKRFRDSYKGIKDSFFGNVLASGFEELARQASRAIEEILLGAGKFKDLEETTGASAESLASMAVAADTAGVSIEEVAGNAIKLTKNLTGVDDESKAAGAAIKALGLNIDDFKKLDPVGQIDALTKAFAGFADGPKKSAVAVALWGKAGAEMLKVLKALEEQGGRTTILTQQQIDDADAYADAQAKAASQLRLYVQGAATQGLHAFNALSVAAKDFIGDIIGIDKATGILAANNGVKEFAERAVRALGFIVDAADGVVRVFQVVGNAIGVNAAIVAAVVDGEFKRAVQIAADGREKIDEILNRPLFSDRLEQALAQANVPVTAKPTATKPVLDFDGRIKGAGKAKKEVDEVAKAIADLDKELALFGQDEEFKKAFEFEGLALAAGLSLDEVAKKVDEYRAKLANLKSLQVEEDIQKTLDALKKERDELGLTTEEIKIHELVLKGASKAHIEFAQSALKDIGADKRKKELENINIELEELKGNLIAAAGLRLDQQFGETRRGAEAAGDSELVRRIDELRKFKIEQAEFTKSAEEAERVLKSLSVQEDRISISRQLGATTELESLRQLGVARQETVRKLEEIVSAEERIAFGPGGTDELKRQAEAARLELEKLAAVADPVGDKFRGIFTEAFSDPFADFLSGTKSAKEAFSDFAKSVLQQMNRIIAQDFAESIFGRGGLLGDFVGSLGGVIAGGQQQSRPPVGASGILPGEWDWMGGGGRSGGGVLGGVLGGGRGGAPGATVALDELARAALGAASALGGVSRPAFGQAANLPSFGGFAAFDTSGIGIGSTQPSAERDALRQIEARAGEAIQNFSTTIQTTTPEISVLGTSADDAGGALSGLPNLLKDLFSGFDFSSLFSGAGGGGDWLSGLASLFGGFFAAGGKPPVGKVSVVGEKGPELFVPKVPGVIVAAQETSRILSSKESELRQLAADRSSFEKVLKESSDESLTRMLSSKESMLERIASTARDSRQILSANDTLKAVTSSFVRDSLTSDRSERSESSVLDRSSDSIVSMVNRVTSLDALRESDRTSVLREIDDSESVLKILTERFGGFYAAGGKPPVGKASIVGEKGPELFVPSVPGAIIPADKTASILSSGADIFKLAELVHKAGPSFDGFRAAGGGVSPFRPVIVGESGRELFVPRTHTQQMPEMAAPTTNVIVQNAPAGSKVERRRNSTGGEDVIVKIKEQIKSEMASEIDNGVGLLGPITRRTGTNGGAGLPM